MVIHLVEISDRIGINDDVFVDLRAWADTLFERTLKEINKRSFDGEERAAAAAHECDLRNQFEVLSAIADRSTRDAAFAAVIASLSLGFHHRGGPEVVKEARTEFGRRQTAKAVDAGRRPPEVEEIIKRHARARWKIQPSYRTNAQGTATLIFPDVTVDIASLTTSYPGWESDFLSKQKPTDEVCKENWQKARKKRIEAIRGFLREWGGVDDRQSST